MMRPASKCHSTRFPVCLSLKAGLYSVPIHLTNEAPEFLNRTHLPSCPPNGCSMNSARNQAAVPRATGDTQYNVPDAALLGASLAFSKPILKPKPQTNTYTGGENGAFLAANIVGTPPPLKRDWTGGSARSVSNRPNASPMQTASKSNSSNTLGVPDSPLDRVPSPSNIAARLAAARHSPLRPQPQATVASISGTRDANERDVLPPSGSVGNVLARFEPHKSLPQPFKRTNSIDSVPLVSLARSETIFKPTGDMPISPTTSLVRMFEQRQPGSDVPTSSTPLNVTQRSPPPIRSPKPQRTFRVPQEPKENPVLQRTRTLSPPPLKPKPQHKTESTLLPSVDGVREQAISNISYREPMQSPPIKQKSIQSTKTKPSTPPPKPPPQRASRSRATTQDDSLPAFGIGRTSTSLDSFGTPESPVSFKSAKEVQDNDVDTEREISKPPVPPSRRSTQRRTNNDSMIQTSQPASDRSQLAAPVPVRTRHQSQAPPSMRSHEPIAPPVRPASTTGTSSPAVYHNKYQRQSMQQITQHMTGETLSSAIMGAALAASSRNASPAPRPMPIEPLFPPRKQHRHHSPFHRSPSPPKQSPPKAAKMRTTMRKEPSSSEDEDEVDKYKKKGTRIMGIKGRKHPNKHHEGTRRRWRDQITERERKRYEGVWAANKGMFLPPSSQSPSQAALENDPSLDVLNISVQEIWTRSRLPTHVLEEVWDLVDSKGVGRLSRYEFVVGLWLIDQRLKGRKLPIKVSDSVWQSARGIGLKVRSIR